MIAIIVLKILKNKFCNAQETRIKTLKSELESFSNETNSNKSDYDKGEN